MHLWKDSISSRNRLQPTNLVHCSQKSWLLGELVTSEITLLILPLPLWFWILMLQAREKKIKTKLKNMEMHLVKLKIQDERTKKKMKNMGMNEESRESKIGEVEKKRGKMQHWFSMNWWFAIYVLLSVLLSPVVLAFIALSVGKDIKMMIGRLCYWMIGKLCNSDSAPQVS